MALPSWQEREMKDPSTQIARLPFDTAKKFFAVDCSGSTIGAIMAAQHRFVAGLHSNAKDQVTKWDHACRDPGLVDGVPAGYYTGSGGTSPESIPRSAKSVKEITCSDLWILLTDGEVGASKVAELARLARSKDFIQVPIIFLITGERYSAPDNTNISVGVPFFASAQEALILFKDHTSGQIFVIDAKGTFEPLKTQKIQTEREADHGELSKWNALPMYPNEAAFCKACGELGIDFEPYSSRRSLKSVSLGPKWASATDDALVNVPRLLEQSHIATQDLQNLLVDETIDQLALICKTRDQITEMRNLLLRHKQQDFVVRFEDRHGASEIMEKMKETENPAEKDSLQEQLRQAHTLNRDTYKRLKDFPSDESKLSAEINRSINRALAVLSDYEKSGYTADILNRKSNRAMRASIVSADDAEIHVMALDLSDTMEACRDTCPICCGEEQIMSIVLKQLETVEENTTDFALNFPLAAGWSKHNKDIVSSQCICFQCALVLERSIFKETIVAKIPAVSYQGPNKKYIDLELYLALTAGLSTGASGIIQLFCTILDRTLETKSWCSISNITDTEVAVRRNVLGWTLQNLLQKCPCRENFSETGQWVQYPRALEWATKDYADAMLDSWIIQYPLAGFNQLLQWYSVLEMHVTTPISIIKRAKLIHLTTTAMMNGLRDEKDGDRCWTYPFLRLIYQSFNSPGVPRDLGQSSIVSSKQFWTKLETALGDWEDVKRFLKHFSSSERHEMTSRIQLIAFWAVFTQKGHTMPKSFFQNITNREPLAHQALNPEASVSDQTIRRVLRSIFVPERKFDKQHSGKVELPFVSPYGPSVLMCGFPNCNVKFFDTSSHIEAINPVNLRERRSKHLQQIYGTNGKFDSLTGLPEPTKAPIAPTSHHTTMHISIARTWAALSIEQKRAISAEVAAQDPACVGTPPSVGPQIDAHEFAQPAITHFTKAVRLQICGRSRRGDIYSATIEKEVRQILPSLMKALCIAGRKMGLKDADGLDFVHDWTQNTLTWKMEYELSL